MFEAFVTREGEEFGYRLWVGRSLEIAKQAVLDRIDRDGWFAGYVTRHGAMVWASDDYLSLTL